MKRKSSVISICLVIVICCAIGFFARESKVDKSIEYPPEIRSFDFLQPPKHRVKLEYLSMSSRYFERYPAFLGDQLVYNEETSDYRWVRWIRGKIVVDKIVSVREGTKVFEDFINRQPAWAIDKGKKGSYLIKPETLPKISSGERKRLMRAYTKFRSEEGSTKYREYFSGSFYKQEKPVPPTRKSR